jgi:hypothetical protein
MTIDFGTLLISGLIMFGFFHRVTANADEENVPKDLSIGELWAHKLLVQERTNLQIGSAPL